MSPYDLPRRQRLSRAVGTAVGFSSIAAAGSIDFVDLHMTVRAAARPMAATAVSSNAWRWKNRVERCLLFSMRIHQ